MPYGLRHRLATLILGYPPVRLPDGACIVVRQGATSAVLTPKTLHISIEQQAGGKRQGSITGTL